MQHILAAAAGGVGGAIAAAVYLYYGVVRPTMREKFKELEEWQTVEVMKMKRDLDAAIIRLRAR